MYWKQVWNKSQTYFDGRFNSGAFFIYLTVRPSTDGKRAPLTAINLQAAGSPQQAPPTYIAKMWKLIKFIKNVIFWRNHTDINPDDWTITKKTIRTTIHENFSKMKNSKVDRWALSLKLNTLRPRQNGRRFADDIFKWTFLNENIWCFIKISLKFVPRGPVNNIPSLV